MTRELESKSLILDAWFARKASVPNHLHRDRYTFTNEMVPRPITKDALFAGNVPSFEGNLLMRFRVEPRQKRLWRESKQQVVIRAIQER